MKSEVMGNVETAAQPLVQKLEALSISGLPVNMDAELIRTVSTTIKVLAKSVDTHSAAFRIDRESRRDRTRFLLSILGLVLIAGVLA